MIVFEDMDENNSRHKRYHQIMDRGENKYTQESYDKYYDR